MLTDVLVKLTNSSKGDTGELGTWIELSVENPPTPIILMALPLKRMLLLDPKFNESMEP